MLEESPIGYNPEFVKRVMAARDQKTREQANGLLRDAMQEARDIVRRAELQAKRIIEQAHDESARVVTMAKAEAYVAVTATKPAESFELRPMEDIAREASDDLGISLEEIMGRSRVLHIARARGTVMAAVYVQRPDLSLNQIARFFGRDHTTVLAAVQKTGVWRGVEVVKRSA